MSKLSQADAVLRCNADRHQAAVRADGSACLRRSGTSNVIGRNDKVTAEGDRLSKEWCVHA